MKILLLCDDHPSAYAGGVATSTLNLARGLAVLRHEVVLVWGEDVENFPIEGVRQIKVPVKRRPIGRDHVMMAGLPVLGALGDWSPDVVHAQQPTPLALWGKYIARRHGAKFIVSFHNLLENVENLFYRQIAQWSYQFAFAIANAIVTPSGFATDYVKRRFAPKAPVFTVSNSIDSARFHQALETPLETAPNGRVQVCSAISLSPYKNPVLMVQLWAELHKLGIDADLKIAGRGAMRSQLEQLAADLGVAERIEFLGTQDQNALARLMHASDALLLTSHAETQGLVLLEAKTVGTPSLVALSATSAAKDFIVHGTTGVLFPVDDLERAVQIVAPFLQQPERLRQMRRAVLADAQQYSCTAVAQKMLEVYCK